mmetsp:Transcript_12385/g.22449  ORF Transcript_12385/g.22449 Transcript_12385/m.22449 type:complete len:210 (-) Transcript_12385:1929-2558(-)
MGTSCRIRAAASDWICGERSPDPDTTWAILRIARFTLLTIRNARASSRSTKFDIGEDASFSLSRRSLCFGLDNSASFCASFSHKLIIGCSCLHHSSRSKFDAPWAGLESVFSDNTVCADRARCTERSMFAGRPNVDGMSVSSNELIHSRYTSLSGEGWGSSKSSVSIAPRPPSTIRSLKYRLRYALNTLKSNGLSIRPPYTEFSMSPWM